MDQIGANGLAEVAHEGPVDALSGSETLVVKLRMVYELYFPLKDGAFYMPLE